MANELASVSETVDLSPQEASNRARAFLTEQGYNVAHHTFTTLTVERYAPDDAGEQVKRTLTVLIQPQRDGGVRIKVVGDDAEGVRERQAEWVEWSEGLPKKSPEEPKAERPQIATETQQDGVLAVAKGVNGHVELFADRVRLKREGFGSNTQKVKDIPIQNLASVKIKPAKSYWHGEVEFVTSDHGDKRWTDRIKYWVIFSLQQSESFEEMRRAVEQRIKEKREGLAEVPVEQEKSESAETPASLPAAFNTAKPATHSSSSTKPTMPPSNTPTSTSEVAGGPEILNKKLRKLAEQHKGEDENIEFCLVSKHVIGGWHQAIVALSDRLLVIKPGMAAGTTFGARVTSFYYHDITGIEINMGLMMGVIEINTPSYQGTAQKDYWNVRDKNKNPMQLTNCLPVDRFELREYKPYIDRLRKMVREAKQGRVVQSTAPNGGNIGSELEKLASLRTSGVLTEEEFQQAKQRLLNQ